MQIDNHGIALAPDYVSVEVPGGTPGRVDAVGLVLRIVFGALEATVIRHPLHRVVLMRARQREHEDVPLEAHDDQLCGVIDIDGVRGGNRIPSLVATLFSCDD